MIKKVEKDTVKGIRINHINNALIAVFAVLCVITFFVSLKLRVQYNNLTEAMNEYSRCNRAVNDFRESSDFLTEQVRLFSVNLDTTFMENYFHEINDIKRRDHAIAVLEEKKELEIASNDLKIALQESKLLMNREYYALRLMCDALHIDENSIPKELKTISISNEDKILSDDEKIEVVRSLMFDSEYLFSKERIAKYTNQSLNNSVNYYLAVQKKNYEINRRCFIRISNLLILLFVVFFISNIIITKLVMKPLKSHIVSIKDGRKMEVKGSFETRCIADAYNKLCEKNAVTASILKHKAEHDALTGLINREGFEQIKTALADSNEPIAYLVVDIDFFKSINDSYGHSVGDDVLRKISTLLMEQFRTSDYVARIGGDEFAIIMTKLGSSAVEIIQRKVASMNRILQQNDDGLPPVSLSVGVAFSEAGFTEALEINSDKALYNVKNGGRCNCAFFN